jgi:catechol 2,3-dioxygenase-like lactoylglutathione lyase family enzyme
MHEAIASATKHAKRRPLRRPATRGVHHLVFCTDDMQKTVDFYVDVVGAPLIHAMKVPPGLGTGPKNRGNPPYENCRHYFFDMGNDSILAFFEIPKGQEPASNRNAIGAAQHVAFVVTAKQFVTLEAHLKAHNVPYLPAVEQGPGMFGIYFYDPNGIRLEFACQPEDGEQQDIIDFFTQTKAEARAELESLPGATPEWVAKRLAALPD